MTFELPHRDFRATLSAAPVIAVVRAPSPIPDASALL